MKLRIVCAGLLLALSTACGSSVTAPSDPARAAASPGQPVLDEDPDPETEDGGGTMGSGH